jgi:GrpB-like predicted nucleotidyltransferase (UPF0157 family)
MEKKDTDNAVTLSEYNTEWPLLFNKEKDFLMKIIGRYLIGSIEHVGSTAVPGLAAKPVIDIMFGVKSLKYSKSAIELLVKNGYCQYALKIDPLCALKIDPPTAKYSVLFLTSFYIDKLHI